METLPSTMFRKRGQRESQPSGVEWQGHILATPRRTKAPKKSYPAVALIRSVGKQQNNKARWVAPLLTPSSSLLYLQLISFLHLGLYQHQHLH